MEQKGGQYYRFTDLDIWKIGHQLRKDVYKITELLPEHEKYNLIGQARRSSCSISANIAEGHGRFHFQENIQYCRQARGSLEETVDHLIAIGALYFSLQQECADIVQTCNTLRAKLNGYISYLQKQKQQ
ncbi:MAG: four helix bundle protein [Candidatus Magasanikbacteria bacterium CG10_big_fil_rev_8_21_14_0_10_42_10]|uniref:Four helix bundle protein n=2 Tax=Candidatus Magasanikiibacteriota TaxID=1752731 RepID=A0A2H0TZJ9_9BACT|nr:MAG: four helix bundle protein [Candidatus Magasanikbacteria bacterium CG10_big_fil_rev_8_21_14_0_10_42_10]PIZ93081.1 MAG: four helix bundle protein [Candidatus Magasanikbacteria bacterium CG_4_10_14_0_2_um_filter_41_10]